MAVQQDIQFSGEMYFHLNFRGNNGSSKLQFTWVTSLLPLVSNLFQLLFEYLFYQWIEIEEENGFDSFTINFVQDKLKHIENI